MRPDRQAHKEYVRAFREIIARIAATLYFDRQYNETFGLLHEDAHEDSVALTLQGIDPAVIDVRLPTPLDLAVSKISRLSDQYREDIATLARRGLVTCRELRQRAQDAANEYVGDLTRLRNSIDIACRIVEDAQPRGSARQRKR